MYECNTRTGKTKISGLETRHYKFEKLIFKKVKKRITELTLKELYSGKVKYVLKIKNKTPEMIDIDILYDLIKADLVEKV